VMIALVWPSSLYLFQRARGVGFTPVQRCLMCGCFVAAAGTSLIIWWWSMRAGVRALERMRG
jgi:hypothetical protein